MLKHVTDRATAACLLANSVVQFLSEEERDALQQVMDDQASTERKYDNERTLACYWEKIKTACQNPITFVAALWGFFYFWAYYGIIYVSDCTDRGGRRLSTDACLDAMMQLRMTALQL
jgi:hypothetical protein